MSVSTESAPRILDIPIGLKASGTRKEFDSLGTVEVPGPTIIGGAQDATQSRTLQHRSRSYAERSLPTLTAT